MSIEEIKSRILPVLKRYGVKRAGVFGSAARGQMSDNSDIDLLVEIEDDISLLDFIALKLELEEKLGKRVDLVEYSTIKPMLREQILKAELSLL